MIAFYIYNLQELYTLTFRKIVEIEDFGEFARISRGKKQKLGGREKRWDCVRGELIEREIGGFARKNVFH